MEISQNSLKLLQDRYLKKKNNAYESPKELFCRVAKTIAAADVYYEKSIAEVKETEDNFYQMLASLDFLPNSPTLLNAGTRFGQLSACFVLPIEDSIGGIFSTLKDAAEIHKSGGGTGFSFSRLRSAGTRVSTGKTSAQGPIAYLDIYNHGLSAVEQGGMRRGGNMAVLKIDHPDILDFINCKSKDKCLPNFNISVAVTDNFMKKLSKNEDYERVDPHTKTKILASTKETWEILTAAAHKNGEPGVIFIDTLNKYNPILNTEIEATNPCGEQPLLPYESCNLGSINLAHFVKSRGIDFSCLKKTVELAIHFLDNVIDVNNYPLKILKDMATANRKIGLGIMGFADMLIALNIHYNSNNAIRLADEIMKFIQKTAKDASAKLAQERGSFPNFKDSIYKDGPAMRNATVTTIAPTGSISLIAGVSSGIEPLFAVSYQHASSSETYRVINPLFENIAKTEGFYSEELMQKIDKNKGSVQGLKEVPEFIQKLFITANDISPEWHVKIQAAFQKHVDNAVSKTVNLPNSATVEDVSELYKLAYKLGCKGITAYRDGSREHQVLTVKNTAEPVGYNCPTGTCSL